MKNFVQKILDPVLVQQLADSAGQVAGCSAVVAAMLGMNELYRDIKINNLS